MKNKQENNELLTTHSQVVDMLKKLEPYSKDGTIPLFVVDKMGRVHRIIDTHVFGKDADNPLYMALRTEPTSVKLAGSVPGGFVSEVGRLIQELTNLSDEDVLHLTDYLRSKGYFIFHQDNIRKKVEQISQLMTKNEQIPMLQSKVAELNEYIGFQHKLIDEQRDHINSLLERLYENK